MIGIITKINYQKGFGFIESGIGDIFFHARDIKNNAFAELKVNSIVTYILLYGDKGLYAKKVYKQK